MKKRVSLIWDTCRMYALLFKYAPFLSLLSLLINLGSGLLLPYSAVLTARLGNEITLHGFSLGGITIALIICIPLIEAVRGITLSVTEYLNVRIIHRIEMPMKLERQQMAAQYDCRWHEREEFAKIVEMSADAVDPYYVTSFLKAFPALASGIVSICSVIFILAKLKWYLALTALFLVTIEVIIVKHYNEANNTALMAGSGERLESQERYEMLIGQDTQGELRIFGKYNWMISQWKTAYLKAQKKVLRVKDMAALFGQLCGISSIIFKLLLLGLLLLSGINRTAESIVLVINAYNTFDVAMIAVWVNFDVLSGYATKVRNYLSLSRAPISKKRNPGTNLFPVSIAARNISFSYDGTTDIIHNISFDIHSGEKIALVGENGSGKTTLAKLILQLYSPQKGKLSITDADGEVSSCRVSAMLQNYVRYELSVRDNITLGDIEKKYCDADLLAQYREICGKDIPFSLDEIVGKRFGDRNPSGGEWQRLAITRALFRDAPLIVLDEPNSSIDAFTEANMIQHIFEVAKDKTCVFITHRLTTTALADRIIVMKDGRICEEGTHEELMHRKGEYARMYYTQARTYIE